MIKSGKSYSYWLARFNRKMSFHFPWVVPLISDRSVWHNGKQPRGPCSQFSFADVCTRAVDFVVVDCVCSGAGVIRMTWTFCELNIIVIQFSVGNLLAMIFQKIPRVANHFN